MIYNALSFLTSELNDYFNRSFQLTDEKAILSAHVSSDGSPVTDTLNKVSITLVNLEQETTTRNLLPDRSSSGEHLRINPSIKLNLRVLIAANFTDYSESLKFLDSTLAFFQGHSLFTPQNSPRLDANIERLTVDLEPTSYNEWSYLWGMLGLKYLPGVVYRVRMVTVQDQIIQGNTPTVRGLGIN